MAKSATRARTQHASRNERATGGGGEATPAEQNRASGAHFTHFDGSGQAHMVDVGAKAASHRIARARGRIRMSDEAFAMVREGSAKKGDVLGVARIAAIQATKRTSDLVPLCHPIALTRVAVSFDLDDVQRAIEIEVTAETVGPTGVEMEALTGAAVGLLTIYDMCKAVDRAMRIEAVRLVEKEGGNSGHFVAA